MDLQKTIHQAVRFLGAGGFALGLYYLTLYLLTEWFSIWYMLSAVTGSLVQFFTGFALKKIFVFEDASRQSAGYQAGRYLALTASLFFTNLALLHLFVEYLHLHYMTAQVANSFILTPPSYIISKKWVFKAQLP